LQLISSALSGGAYLTNQHDHYLHQQLTAVDVGELCVSVQGSIACFWLIGERLVMFFHFKRLIILQQKHF